MNFGAIILCGGKSTRMGRDKATLPFGPESMLQRVVRLLGEVVPFENTVIVAAADQALPRLPEAVLLAHDLQPDRGPLEGLAAGLRALPARVDAAYVTSCDVPLLVPAFVRTMFELLETPSDRFEIAVPKDGEHHHPLAAVYRRSVVSAVERLLAQNRLRPRFLFEDVPTRDVSVEELHTVDPRLDTLKNLNTPAEYQAALKSAGLGSDIMTLAASRPKGRKPRRKPSRLIVRPRLKLWLEAGGESVFCRGIADILQAVDRTHSIKAAAEEVGRSYRFVWARIKSAEAALGAKLVAAQVGGKGTQRSELTPLAAGLLREFDRLRQDAHHLIDDVYAKRINAVLKKFPP